MTTARPIPASSRSPTIFPGGSVKPSAGISPTWAWESMISPNSGGRAIGSAGPAVTPIPEPYLERLGRRGVGDHEAVVSWIDLRDRLPDQHQDGWLEWRLDLLENLEGVGIENASKGGALRHAGAQLADLHIRVHESTVVGPQGDEFGDQGPLRRKLR